MNKKRIVVYPFNEECKVFSDYLELLDEKYIFAEAASPAAWGFAGKTINTSEGEYVIKKSPTEFEGEADILLIPDFVIMEKAEPSLISEIISFIPFVEKVIYYAGFSEKSKKIITDKCFETGCEFWDLKNYSDSYNFDIENKIINTKVPVVAVAGLWEDTDKFKVALSLRRGLINNGYKVSQIGSRGYAELFGAHPFPSFMMNTGISEFIKPIMFSKYIDNIVKEENPDIIIVGIPGSLQSLNNDFPNNCGILPYMTFQALNVDYFVLCTFFDTNPLKFNKAISDMCMYKYGVKPDMIHMSKTSIDMLSTNERHRIHYFHTDDETVNNTISSVYGDDNLMTNLTYAENEKMVAGKIIEKLSCDNFSI